MQQSRIGQREHATTDFACVYELRGLTGRGGPGSQIVKLAKWLRRDEMDARARRAPKRAGDDAEALREDGGTSRKQPKSQRARRFFLAHSLVDLPKRRREGLLLDPPTSRGRRSDDSRSQAGSFGTPAVHALDGRSRTSSAAPRAHFLARSLSPRAFACAVAACDGSSGAFECPPLPLQVIGQREACRMVRRSSPPARISSPPHSHPLCLAPVHPSPYPY